MINCPFCEKKMYYFDCYKHCNESPKICERIFELRLDQNNKIIGYKFDYYNNNGVIVNVDAYKNNNTTLIDDSMYNTFISFDQENPLQFILNFENKILKLKSFL